MATVSPVKLQKIIKEFETLRTEAKTSNVITTDLMLVILEVGKGNGVSGRDVEMMLDMTTSKAQRIMDVLRKEQKNGARGYGLVEEKPDPTNHRSIIRFPNARLKEFMKTVEGHLNG